MALATESSQAIVSFISGLLPLYRPEYVGKGIWARSERDGTIIKPIAEIEDDDGGCIEVWWQGDKARMSIEKGGFLAQLALSDYVDFHCRGKPDRYREQMEQLFEHFRLKTGQTLRSEDEPLLEFLEVFSKALGKLGRATLLELIKKMAGL